MTCEAVVAGKAAYNGSFFLITTVSPFVPVRHHALGLYSYDNRADGKGQPKVAR